MLAVVKGGGFMRWLSSLLGGTPVNGSRLTGLARNVEQIAIKVDRLEKGQVELKGAVERIEKDQKVLKGTVDRLEGTVGRIEKDQEVLKGTVNRLEGTVDRLEGAVARLEQGQEELKAGHKVLMENQLKLQSGISTIIARLDSREPVQV